MRITCKIDTVSTPSTPPMRLINAPHRSTHFLISTRCGMAPSTRGIISTMPATTASRTRRRGTLLAIRSVLSSMLAFSSERPSENARSSDRRTSIWNSCSPAVLTPTGRDVTDDAREALCDAYSSSSDSGDISAEVTEPGSDGTRSAKSSPRHRYVDAVRPQHTDGNIPNRISRMLLKDSNLSSPSLSPSWATLRGHTKASESGPRLCERKGWSTHVVARSASRAVS